MLALRASRAARATSRARERVTARTYRAPAAGGRVGLRLPQVGRTPARVRHHYEVERELADRLRRAGPGERLRLYSEVYDELFRRVPDHPQLTGDGYGDEHVDQLLRVVRPFLGSDSVF